MKRNVKLAAIPVTIITVVVVIAAVTGIMLLRDRDKGKEESATLQQTNEEKVGIVDVVPNTEQVGRYDKFELLVHLSETYSNPYDPAEVDLSATFQSPTGAEWPINGFYDGSDWRIRFSPSETGDWSYNISLKDSAGSSTLDGGKFAVTASDHHGWIEVSKTNKRFLQYNDGTSFFGVGVAYPWGINETMLDVLVNNGVNYITYWNGNYDNSGSGGGNEQLESVTSGIGRYDVAKGKRVDELLDSFEKRDLIMNFVVWPHDSLADKINWPATWTKNAYSALGEAKDFYASDAAWAYQEKLYRYMIARWGYSRSLGVWDLVVEVNGTDGWQLGDQAKANEWLTKIHDYFAKNDPYHRPTSASMAGNKEDYWDHAYQTVDVSDRENYYDIGHDAFAEDIQKRWASYEKPLIIGETGNVADVNAYHNAIWVALANGLASSPVWWDIEKVDEPMFGQMKVLSQFVHPIDFNEQRKPVKANAPSVEVPLPSSIPLIGEGEDKSSWSVPDWAPANKDAQGVVYAAEVTGTGDDRVVSVPMRFATGEFSQGYYDNSGGLSDWRGYDAFVFEVKAEGAGADGLLAKAVLHPTGQWTEADDAQSVKLKAGEWTTITVPLKDVPEHYWRDATIPEDALDTIVRWGVKVYAQQTPKEAEPVTISVRHPKLTTKQPKTIMKAESSAWLMKGEQLSYGWQIAAEGSVGGHTVSIPEWGSKAANVQWIDAWTGDVLKEEQVQPDATGSLPLTAPATERSDVAFRIFDQ
ncbi:uncharacterized protein DUF5060 [Paenibacillus cellulosilyticus]|uniref:Uncharacterized protein DUF5060 n=1 Tax=Paenibacillus cellulosilyticus TaxID=375489 RepID=A0A2V2Z2W9_9BACL|nr:DUF5060 domain-containing protein [Paenibacillus cellulosilyticus]PWW07445.1 uncharacterized protein DUF5060 [Paenibacillus cellulosilyticus]QKS44396.1 DUF5060 domain-containing protein [Paenibacillus cellulosilyticus]